MVVVSFNEIFMEHSRFSAGGRRGARSGAGKAIHPATVNKGRKGRDPLCRDP